MRLQGLIASGLMFSSLIAADSRAGIFFNRIWGNAFVTTEMTPQGRNYRAPTPDNPVYFLGKSLGCTYEGLHGESVPDEKAMIQFATRVLARQGFVGAKSGMKEPSLYLVMQWGYFQPGRHDIAWMLGYDPNQDIAAPLMAGFLGAEVYRRNARSEVTQAIIDNAGDSIYGIIITAFDFRSASTTKPIVLWQSRIGLSTRGKSMSSALPTMLAAAGPSIGRDTQGASLHDADDARPGHVTFDELKVIDVLDNDQGGQSPKRR